MKFTEEFDSLYDSKVEIDDLITVYPHREIKRFILQTLVIELLLEGPVAELAMMKLLEERFPELSPVHYFHTPSSQHRVLSFPFKEALAREGLLEVFNYGDSHNNFVAPTATTKAFLDSQPEAGSQEEA